MYYPVLNLICWLLQFLLHQRLNYPRGRGLGGAGSINYLSYTRGNRYDFDEWADLGCDGWSYRDLLPYMIKSEANANDDYVKSGQSLHQSEIKLKLLY